MVRLEKHFANLNTKKGKKYMTSSKKVRYTFRIKKTLLDKLGHIAKFDGKTENEEIELMILEWIRAYEDIYGKIITD